ncbi:hypothetical protein JHK87_022932 [Glycine soja]|nr:hypothetical protein JHK87_022932 [Glycine soja]
MSLPQPNRIDPKIWRVCVGTIVQIPKLHSRVYYFPQGHMEDASPSHYLSPLVRSLPFVPCHVSSLDFLADPFSDEVSLLGVPSPLMVFYQMIDTGIKLIIMDENFLQNRKPLPWMEVKADYIGLLLIASASYDPRVVPKVYEELGKFAGDSTFGNYFSTHPSGHT